jgi:hypothetical protein
MQTKIFVQDLKDEIRHEQEYKYQVPFEKGSYYKNLVDIISTSLEDSSLLPSYFSFFKDMFGFHFEYSVFAYTELDIREEALTHLNQAISYGSILLQEAPKMCACLKDSNPFVISNKATFMTSLFLLGEDNTTFNQVTKHLIDSLNGKNCIIKKGYNKATISWFVLKLFSLYSKEEITLHKLLQPQLDQRYVDVLKNWDTIDMKEIVIMVELLCELHLLQATLDLADADEHDEDDINNLRYRELFLPAMYSFPYEILTWLKLRERAGLKNPKTFSHPLMNTPIAKMFLSLKEPLPKPTELPYAKELLEKIKEKCPDVEIPEWLNTETKEEFTPPQNNNTIPDDFMR